MSENITKLSPSLNQTAIFTKWRNFVSWLKKQCYLVNHAAFERHLLDPLQLSLIDSSSQPTELDSAKWCKWCAHRLKFVSKFGADSTKLNLPEMQGNTNFLQHLAGDCTVTPFVTCDPPSV